MTDTLLMSSDSFVPRGEVLLDGRVMRPDGSWSGVKVAGEVVRGDTSGLAPGCVTVHETRADVFWLETFMERLQRHAERRESVAG